METIHNCRVLWGYCREEGTYNNQTLRETGKFSEEIVCNETDKEEKADEEKDRVDEDTGDSESRPQCLLLFLTASSDLQMTAKNELFRYQ